MVKEKKNPLKSLLQILKFVLEKNTLIYIYI